jgi:pyrrolidone-carboxylate peptidase
MGVAEGRKYFAVEQTSQKYGYNWSIDVDGKSFTTEESDKYFAGQPTTLSTDLALTTVVSEWQQRTADVKWPPGLETADESGFAANSAVEVKLLEDVMDTQDVRWSDSVGTYLCGFIYYTGMAEMGKNGKNKLRDVAFMHVPSLPTEEHLAVGVDVAIELVQSLVQTWRSQRGA